MPVKDHGGTTSTKPSPAMNDQLPNPLFHRKRPLPLRTPPDPFLLRPGLRRQTGPSRTLSSLAMFLWWSSCPGWPTQFPMLPSRSDNTLVSLNIDRLCVETNRSASPFRDSLHDISSPRQNDHSSSFHERFDPTSRATADEDGVVSTVVVDVPASTRDRVTRLVYP
jgi:hypothetical protein